MHRLAAHLIIALLAFESSLTAAPSTRIADEKHAQTDAQAQSVERVPVNLHPNYSEILTMLKALVTRFGKAGRNTLYISQVERQGEGEYAYIYWKQDNSIIILNLPLKKPLEQETAFWLYTGKARIDLLKGVVAAEAQIGTSTFLVSKPWVEKIIKDCMSNGLKISLSKAKSRRRAPSRKSFRRSRSRTQAQILTAAKQAQVSSEMSHAR